MIRQELQSQLRVLVGLAQDRDVGLGQDVALGEVGGFLSHVRVTDTAVGCFQVLLIDAQVIDRRIEAVLKSAESRAVFVEVRDCSIDFREVLLGIFFARGRDIARGRKNRDRGRQTVRVIDEPVDHRDCYSRRLEYRDLATDRSRAWFR